MVKMEHTVLPGSSTQHRNAIPSRSSKKHHKIRLLLQILKNHSSHRFRLRLLLGRTAGPIFRNRQKTVSGRAWAARVNAGFSTHVSHRMTYNLQPYSNCVLPSLQHLRTNQCLVPVTVGCHTSTTFVLSSPRPWFWFVAFSRLCRASINSPGSLQLQVSWRASRRGFESLGILAPGLLSACGMQKNGKEDGVRSAELAGRGGHYLLIIVGRRPTIDQAAKSCKRKPRGLSGKDEKKWKIFIFSL